MPAAAARPLLELDFTHTALYDELAKIGAPVPNQGWERLTPMILTPADRATLGMKRAEAAFFLERLGRRDDQPVEWRTTIIRGDRYRFVADWSDGVGAHCCRQPTDRPARALPVDARFEEPVGGVLGSNSSRSAEGRWLAPAASVGGGKGIVSWA
ncbi:MAG: UTRA domain-containing protein [Acidimicrobiales bacterium]